ncbi:hypothetical protein V8C26DRAFT_409333 [Trichoderma gracile]
MVISYQFQAKHMYSCYFTWWLVTLITSSVHLLATNLQRLTRQCEVNPGHMHISPSDVVGSAVRRTHGPRRKFYKTL